MSPLGQANGGHERHALDDASMHDRPGTGVETQSLLPRAGPHCEGRAMPELVRPRCLSAFPKGWSGRALVLMDQAAKDVVATDRSDVPLSGRGTGSSNRNPRWGRAWL